MKLSASLIIWLILLVVAVPFRKQLIIIQIRLYPVLSTLDSMYTGKLNESLTIEYDKFTQLTML